MEATYTLESPAANPACEAPWVQFTIPSGACEDRVEEIYEDLCYVKFTSATPEVAYRHIISALVDTIRFHVDRNYLFIFCFCRLLSLYRSPLR